MDKIKYMSLDIETFSSADLKTCGVYRYSEASDFEILLLGYSINGGTVSTIDIASGETVPDEIIHALLDDNVTKWAFNASFERVCLSSWLKKNYPSHFHGYGTGENYIDYLNPVSWRCSMVWSAYLGLPLSLEGVGKILKLQDQKMKEGSSLIRYFCSPCYPTISNGHRTRNLPYHDPFKWATFKAYNIRDVEVEMAIQNKLEKHPVPDTVWEEYHIDQTINDRGIALDMKLVKNAIAFDEKSRSSITEGLRDLTNLDNPNSVMQMKSWLKEQGLETETLGKKAVVSLLSETDGNIRSALELRLQLAKSSIKKYQAMENTACKDNRAHGMFQFYGANRTGRWCLTGDHEVLTKHGWVRLDCWEGGPIAVWNAQSEAVSFQKANALCFDYTGPMYTYKDCRIDQCSTPDHKMRAKRRIDKEWEDLTVQEMAKSRPFIPLTGYKDYRCCADPAWLRVLIMTQADGYYCDDGIVRYHFKKQRKVERCKMLLRKAQIYFLENKFSNGVTSISIPARCVPLWLRQFTDKTFGFWLFDENPDIFFDELRYWDGYYPAPNSIQYSTTNKTNADIVQALAHLSGRTAVLRVKKMPKNPNWKQSYVVDIWLNASNAHEIRVKPEISDFEGKVYCAETPTGYFPVRRNGKVWVTGNSGRHIQLQNLPQNHLSDLEGARNLVLSGNYDVLSMLYDDIPDTLSQLIRTAFIPKEGYKFIVSDYSAIEARVLSFLAGESWRIEVFKNNGDIYCASASAMFKVPVEKHGQNSHLRQKGKIAELALGYGGSVGALKAMGALSMGLKEEELQPLVTSWRNANTQIVGFWWEVDNAVRRAISEQTTVSTHGLTFEYKGGMMYIHLPSGRMLSYVKPKIEESESGSDIITYEGIGSTKKWERIQSYGPKFVENIVQAISRDILAFAMKTLKDMRIVAHVHDELIIECPLETKVEDVCNAMGITPPWIQGLCLRADGDEMMFYQKA